MKRKTLFTWIAIFLVMPILVSAAGLVPCGGKTESTCQFCHVATLLSSVMSWLVLILSILFTIIIVVVGFRMVVSSGNAESKVAAKKMVTNSFIGFVIVLAAWLLVDFGLKALLSPSSPVFGTWNAIQCVPQPVYSANLQGVRGGTLTSLDCASTGIDSNGNPTYDCSSQAAQCSASGGVPTVVASGASINCVMPSSGGGSCEVITDTTNACHPSNLGCFNDADAASQICNLESAGGNTSAESGTDLCQDGKSFSVGLWQINLLVNSNLIAGCPAGVFTSDSCGTNCQGSCLNRVPNSNGDFYCAMWDCRVVNTTGYNTCVAAAKNAATNQAAACSLYDTQGRSAWAFSADSCGVNP